MIAKGTRLRHKNMGDCATVIYVDGKEITILVDGYAASDTYDLNALVAYWDVIG